MNTKIRTKAEFYQLWNKGAFGNKPRTWSSVEELEASGYTGLVSARVVGSAGGGKCQYNVRACDAREVTKGWVNPTFNESAPDDKLLIQGEVGYLAESGFYIRYDTTPNTKMRDAMKQAKDAHGVVARVLLRSTMTPSSYADLEALFELYPDSVVEFSTYSVGVGDIPGRNTLIWECRNY